MAAWRWIGGTVAMTGLGCLAVAGAIAATRAPEANMEAGAPQTAGAHAPARDADTPRSVAVAACVARHGGAAIPLNAVGDGMGDWLVWVQDGQGELWGCNADAAGRVYVHAKLDGDLLDGDGGELSPGIVPASTSAARDPGIADQGVPDAAARRLCLAVGRAVPGAAPGDPSVVAATPDGMGDTAVWLRLADDRLWLCDASAAGELFVFEPVGFPLDDVPGAPAPAAPSPAGAARIAVATSR